MRTIVYAAAVYLILMIMMRLTGRRAPNMMTSLDMVLIFLFAGMSVPAIMRDERSLLNMLVGVMTIAMIHMLVSTLKIKSKIFAKLADSTPLVLVSNGEWHTDVMRIERVTEEDVLFSARQAGIERHDQIGYAILERDGSISVFSTN